MQVQASMLGDIGFESWNQIILLVLTLTQLQLILTMTLSETDETNNVVTGTFEVVSCQHQLSPPD